MSRNLKRVLLVSPNKRDNCSFWRCAGPWAHLAKHNDNLEITLWDSNQKETTLSWDDITQYDLVFMHRPTMDDNLTIAKIAKNVGVPIWSDLDDDLFTIRPSNPTYREYGNDKTQLITAHCLAVSDIVTTSTQALADKFSKINPQTILVPNAYRSDIFTYRQEELQPREPLFLWRGSATHDEDMQSVADGFPKLTQKTIFMGHPYWGVLNQMKQGTYQVVPSQDMFNFYQAIYQMKPKVMLAPLVDNEFNQAKSNIAWLEAMHAGAVLIAPDMPEFKKPGVITYIAGNAISFSEAANEAMALSDIEHADIVTTAFNHMKSLYDISVVNKVREQILTALFNGKYVKNLKDPADTMFGLYSLSQVKNIPLVKVDRKDLPQS